MPLPPPEVRTSVPSVIIASVVAVIASPVEVTFSVPASMEIYPFVASSELSD